MCSLFGRRTSLGYIAKQTSEFVKWAEIIILSDPGDRNRIGDEDAVRRTRKDTI